MLQRLKDLIQSIRDAYARPAVALGGAAADSARNGAARAAAGIAGAKGAKPAPRGSTSAASS